MWSAQLSCQQILQSTNVQKCIGYKYCTSHSRSSCDNDQFTNYFSSPENGTRLLTVCRYFYLFGLVDKINRTVLIPLTVGVLLTSSVYIVLEFQLVSVRFFSLLAIVMHNKHSLNDITSEALADLPQLQIQQQEK
ncbi:hypothetical protein XENOCAPTIV_007238 [Xenoophorus captivus]|uniref:Uncharacterized protein n=1 Tax=Xenoophorus captivus TaxID=1517983 RepID=A0ABV0R7E7_9TELE